MFCCLNSLQSSSSIYSITFQMCPCPEIGFAQIPWFKTSCSFNCNYFEVDPPFADRPKSCKILLFHIYIYTYIYIHYPWLFFLHSINSKKMRCLKRKSSAGFNMSNPHCLVILSWSPTCKCNSRSKWISHHSSRDYIPTYGGYYHGCSHMYVCIYICVYIDIYIYILYM